MTCQSNTVFRGTLTIRALVMGDGVPCYGALEIVGLLLLLRRLLLMRVFLLHLCTKFKLRRPSRSDDIAHLLCEH